MIKYLEVCIIQCYVYYDLVIIYSSVQMFAWRMQMNMQQKC